MLELPKLGGLINVKQEITSKQSYLYIFITAICLVLLTTVTLAENIFSDFEDGTLQGWRVETGDATLKVVALGAQNTNYAMQVAYRFQTANDVIELTGDFDRGLQGHNIIQFWVSGDSSNNLLVVKVTDKSGTWEYVHPIDFSGYSRVAVSAEQFSYTGSGTPINKYVDFSNLNSLSFLIKRKDATSNVEGTLLIDELSPYHGVALSGKVSLANSTNNSGVLVTATSQENQFYTYTDVAGDYNLYLPSGVYTIEASIFGYDSQSREVTIGEYNVPINFLLEKAEVNASLMVYQDFEDEAYIKSLGLIPAQNHVKTGTMSAKWERHDNRHTIRMVGGNWSGYEYITFWVYSEVANGAGVQVNMYSDNPDTSGPDYYTTSFKIDWVGWKYFSIPLKACVVSRNPIGWHKIDTLEFTTTGWGWTPNPTSVLYLDSFVLTAAKPGSISGNIAVDGEGNKDGVRVEMSSASGLTYFANTDATGFYNLERVMPGDYKLTVTRSGYEPIVREISVEAEKATKLDLTLLLLGRLGKPDQFEGDASIPGEVKLTWLAPDLSAGGTLAHSYEIYRVKKDEIPNTQVYASVIDPYPTLSGNQVQWIDLDVDSVEYDYYIIPVDENGNKGDMAGPVRIAAQKDSDPPSPVQSFMIDDSNPDVVMLTWSAPEAQEYIDQAVAYRVYRSVAGNNKFELVEEIQSLADQNSWTDSQLALGTKYEYYITALDHVGNESSASQTILAEPHVTYISISHRPAKLNLADQALKIIADVTTDGESVECIVFYKAVGASSYNQIIMQQAANGSFEGEIDVSEVGEIEYYFQVNNGTKTLLYPDLMQGEAPFKVKNVALDNSAVGISSALAFPNPFSPSSQGNDAITSIEYILGVAADVTISVHNTAGKLVKQEQLGFQEAGKQVYLWDGTDAAGRAVASGPYLCTITAQIENGIANKKTLLIVVIR